jgi:hypothetical protein
VTTRRTPHRSVRAARGTRTATRPRPRAAPHAPPRRRLFAVVSPFVRPPPSSYGIGSPRLRRPVRSSRRTGSQLPRASVGHAGCACLRSAPMRMISIAAARGHDPHPPPPPPPPARAHESRPTRAGIRSVARATCPGARRAARSRGSGTKSPGRAGVSRSRRTRGRPVAAAAAAAGLGPGPSGREGIPYEDTARSVAVAFPRLTRPWVALLLGTTRARVVLCVRRRRRIGCPQSFYHGSTRPNAR